MRHKNTFHKIAAVDVSGEWQIRRDVRTPASALPTTPVYDLSDVPIRTLLGPASRLTPSLEAPEKATETITAPKGLLAALAGKKARPDPYGYRLDRLY